MPLSVWKHKFTLTVYCFKVYYCISIKRMLKSTYFHNGKHNIFFLVWKIAALFLSPAWFCYLEGWIYILQAVCSWSCVWIQCLHSQEYFKSFDQPESSLLWQWALNSWQLWGNIIEVEDRVIYRAVIMTAAFFFLFFYA